MRYTHGVEVLDPSEQLIQILDQQLQVIQADETVLEGFLLHMAGH